MSLRLHIIVLLVFGTTLHAADSKTPTITCRDQAGKFTFTEVFGDGSGSTNKSARVGAVDYEFTHLSNELPTGSVRVITWISVDGSFLQYRELSNGGAASMAHPASHFATLYDASSAKWSTALVRCQTSGDWESFIN